MKSEWGTVRHRWKRKKVTLLRTYYSVQKLHTLLYFLALG